MTVIVVLGVDVTQGLHDTGNALATSTAAGALEPKTAVAQPPAGARRPVVYAVGVRSLGLVSASRRVDDGAREGPARGTRWAASRWPRLLHARAGRGGRRAGEMLSFEQVYPTMVPKS